MKNKFRSFTDVRKFVLTLNLKSNPEWRKYCQSGNKPNNIPTNPEKIYKKEWKNWGYFLGTGTIAPKDKQFRSFKDARKFVQKLKLKNYKEWQEYCQSGNKPNNIPKTPHSTYKKEWKGSGDWVGTGTIAPKDRQFRSFEEARKFVQKLNLKSNTEWKKYYKSGNKPDDIPSAPERTYKKEWKGLGDWLGTGTIAPQNRKFRSYEEAKKFLHKLGLKGTKDWEEYCKSGNKPNDIPSNPWIVYKEWKK